MSKIIYTIYNMETRDVVIAYDTAAAARSHLIDRLTDEKNTEISMVLLQTNTTKEKKREQIDKVNNIYEASFRRLDASYDFYYHNPNVNYFEVDEYMVIETILEEVNG